MIRAYDEVYLKNARSVLANSLDYATYALGYDPDVYYKMFIKCDLARKLEKGNPFIVAGMSGIELALRVVEKATGRYDPADRTVRLAKSREYWAGWAIAYYQWYSSCNLMLLEEQVPFNSIRLMYDKYHEMDICHFVEDINKMRMENRLSCYLKLYREMKGLSQSGLARLADVPVRTLQQYEQGAKSLDKANVNYVLSLAKALGCSPEELLQ